MQISMLSSFRKIIEGETPSLIFSFFMIIFVYFACFAASHSNIEVKFDGVVVSCTRKENELIIENDQADTPAVDQNYNKSLYIQGTATIDDQTLTVTRIGAGAFAKTALSSITLPDTITEIDAGAFSNMINCQLVDLSQTKIQIISTKLFFCSNISEIKLPTTITSIEEKAFEKCTVQNPSFPFSLKSIARAAFRNCTNISEISLENTEITVIPSQCFSNTTLKSIKLPEKLQTISDRAFYNTNITSITLSNQLTEIQEYAFANCFFLASIDISETQITCIHVGTFENCTSLQRIRTCLQIRQICNRSFYNSGLMSFMSMQGIEIVSPYAFENCQELNTVDFSRSKLTFIGEFAFANCPKLESIKLSPSVESIGIGAFKKTKVSVFENYMNLKEIGASAFEHCTSLTNVTIYSPFITIIQKRTFLNCTSLKFIVLSPNITTICEEAFRETSITNFSSDTVSVFKFNAFAECEQLITVSLMSPLLEEIPENMFIMCESLQHVSLSNSTRVINSQAFAFCFELQKVNFMNTKISCIHESAFSFTSKLKQIDFPNTLTSLGVGAFYSSGLTTINLPNGLKEIGHGCFCFSELQAISLPETVTIINDGVFNTTKLKHVFMSNVVEIHEAAFMNTELEVIEFPRNIKFIGKFAFYNTKLQAISLSATKIEVINDYCFANSSCLAAATFPNSLTRIEKYCFYNSPKISEINLENTKLQFIGPSAFMNCTALEDIRIPATIKSIGKSCFEFAAVKSFIFECPINTIGSYAFANMKYLEKVDLFATNITYLSKEMFLNDFLLNEIILPKGITSFDFGALSFCGLKSIVLPDSVNLISECLFASSALRSCDLSRAQLTHLPMRLFYNCTSIEFVKVPHSIEVIGIEVFMHSSIKDFHFNRKLKQLSYGAFAYSNIEKVDLSRTNLYELSKEVFMETPLTSFKLPGKLTTLQDFCFAGTSITQFIAGPNISYIGTKCFSNCQKLTLIDLSKSDISIVPSGFVFNCTSLTEFKLSNSTHGLGDYAFSSCIFKKHVFGSTIESIKAFCFSNSELVEEIDLSNTKIKVIEEGTFYGCISLKTIKLPTTVTALLESAFSQTAIEEFVFNSAISEIGDALFQNCTKLKRVDLSNTTIQKLTAFMFNNCINLDSINRPKCCTYYANSCLSNTAITDISLAEHVFLEERVFFGCKYLEHININLMNNTKIPDYTFHGTPIKEINFPPNIISIGQQVLSEASIKEFIGGPNLAEIGEYCFECCAHLEFVDLSKTLVDKLNEGLFINCTKIKEVKLPQNLRSIGQICFAFSGIEEFIGTSFLDVIHDGAFMGSKIKSVDLLASPITTIGDKAFADTPLLSEFNIKYIEMYGEKCFMSSGIKEFTFTQGLVFIKPFCFACCNKLVNIDLSKTSITEIPESAFANSTSIGWVQFPSGLKSIHNYAFYQTALTKVTLPEKITLIGNFSFSHIKTLEEFDASTCSDVTIYEGAFKNCAHLKNVNIPSIISIHDYAFEGTLIDKVSLPSSLTKVGRGIYKNCKALEKVDIYMLKLTIISPEMFMHCTNLMHISLPYNIKVISKDSFEGCMNLKRIRYCGGSEVTGDFILPEGAVVYVSEAYPGDLFGGFPVRKSNKCNDWNSFVEPRGNTFLVVFFSVSSIFAAIFVVILVAKFAGVKVALIIEAKNNDTDMLLRPRQESNSYAEEDY